ncbi:LysR family transcriptional regulator [Aestuariirhabdus sp. Z084]|uniref:LysR family transcriptional regulator n=1 Tax=Aestuariirhabdus haliotis TaxID=2918751 RepID=UPI00201B4016|nr:LysR family transcriptional regulator [Aestuariirhabdus haliotis]MCL6417367.1 LysR family transcriptional regulator [Aestuariirhabdus haliotis]MCL6421312.1 LysR family transcriptional regulator [Aestuariirhabdus haliotis]
MHNWEDVHFFIEVAKSGSYSAAAINLKVNHTTVSRRIQSLESTIGLKLFHNSGKGVEMTEAAREVFQQAVDIEEANHRFGRTLSNYDDRLSGEICLTMPHDIFSFFLADALSEFKELYPDIELNLTLSQDVINVGTKHSDVAVRLSKSPPVDLIGTRISSLTHHLYKHNNIDHKKNADLILWDDDLEMPEWAQKYFPNSVCSVRINDLNAMYTAVKSGFGIACMPKYLPDHFNDKSVVKLNMKSYESGWSLWVLSHIELRQNVRMKAIKSHIVKALQSKKECF